MRSHSLWLASLTAPAIAALAAYGVVAAAPPPPRLADLPGARTSAAVDVDVELVLAVDISYSMDPDELALQREGYVEALTSPEFLGALKHGMHGRVAVTYVEWAGVIDQKVVLPWRLIEGRETAEGPADHERAARIYLPVCSNAVEQPPEEGHVIGASRRTVRVYARPGPPARRVRRPASVTCR